MRQHKDCKDCPQVAAAYNRAYIMNTDNLDGIIRRYSDIISGLLAENEALHILLAAKERDCGKDSCGNGAEGVSDSKPMYL